MFRLKGIPLRVDRRIGVIDHHVVNGNFLYIFHDSSGSLSRIPQGISLWALPQPGAFHLVENRVVAPVDCIPPVDIGHHCISHLLWVCLPILIHALEISLLMGTRVCSQNGIPIDIVGVGAAATRMIWRKTEDIEILSGGNDGVLFDIIAVNRARKLAFNESSGNCERVILVKI